ncbi:type III-B CRISPR module RAMP protein Cmr6 [Paludibaculum fermentans]|uniref:type III-B CRISPR module RAMP protein Cmr6 n=1 Tax=Paludibaculum fermentans TaxID=1473598 RepID=UPI003EB7E1FC
MATTAKYKPRWPDCAGCSNGALLLYREPMVEDHPKAATPVGCALEGLNRLLQQADTASLIQNLYGRARQGWISLRARGIPVLELIVTIRRPLALGLSEGRVDDMSFQLHPVYGTPYLGSSALKGALRHWAFTYADPEISKTTLDKRLGDMAGEAEVRITEAWPVAANSYFQQGVFTPHLKPFFEGETAKGPVDWNNPTPVEFLCLRPGVQFHLALLGRRPDTPVAYLQEVYEWLHGSMREAGVGGRSRKGYGRLRVEVVPE